MTKEILKKINSNDISIQIEGLDEAIVIWDVFSDQLVNLLHGPTDSLFIAEKISSILEHLFTKLDTAFQKTSNENVKCQIALIFLTNNNMTKVPYLLEFSEDTDNVSDAVFCLIKMKSKGVQEVKSIAQKWLIRLKENDFLVNDPFKRKDLIEALQDII